MRKFTLMSFAVGILAGAGFVSPNSARATVTYTDAVTGDTPAAFYHMAETSGTTMVDSISPPANNGVYSGTLTLNVAGPQSPTFPGFSASNAGIHADDQPAVGPFSNNSTGQAAVSAISGLSTTTYSMELWFNYSSTKLQYLLGRGSGASLSYDSVGLNGGTLLFFNGTGGATFDGGVSQNAWHDLVFTRNGTTVNIYLDGVNVINPGTFTSQSTSSANTFGASTRIVVGNRPGDLGALNPTSFYDELSVYNTELSASQVLAHYNAAVFAPEPASVVMLGLGALGLLRRNRRHGI